MSSKITVTCKHCGEKEVMTRDWYDEFNTLAQSVLVCQKCSYVILPKKYSGKKPHEVEL